MYMLYFFTGAHNHTLHTTVQGAQERFAAYLAQYHPGVQCTGWTFAHGFHTPTLTGDIGQVADAYLVQIAVDVEIEPV